MAQAKESTKQEDGNKQSGKDEPENEGEGSGQINGHNTNDRRQWREAIKEQRELKFRDTI